MTITEILKRLQEGNARFSSDRLKGELKGNQRRRALIAGQNPFAVVLSCADSRVVPELAFDTGIGELFVVRVAGNVANTSSIASIEYAVAFLKTKVIVVLGHQSCGAVTAALQEDDYGDNIKHLLSHIKPAISALFAVTSVDQVAKKNARLTAEELVNKSVIIKNGVDNQSLAIVSAFYNLDTGKVDFFD